MPLRGMINAIPLCLFKNVGLYDNFVVATEVGVRDRIKFFGSPPPFVKNLGQSSHVLHKAYYVHITF